VMEGLGYGCRDNGLLFSINAQMWSVQLPLWKVGSDYLKERYLTKMCSGEMIGAHCMTEPDSGSDAYSLRTSAVEDGDDYVLNGSKTFCTNAPIADAFIVFARVGNSKGFMGVTGFMIDRDTPGLSIEQPIHKMGLRTSPMAMVVLEDCRVPAKNIVGRKGDGARIFQTSMEWERACLLACDLGGMRRQMEECIKYSRERKQFGQPIAKFQSVSNKIVDMKLRLETSRLLLYKVAWMKSQGQTDLGMWAALAKLQLSESWVQSGLDAIQVHGGYGYSTEYEIERELRDAISSRIYSGTSEIQRNIIANHLGL